MARKWTEDEEVLALGLYCRTPFGKISASNPSIKALASMMNRTPASVSMKMCNFARFDPALQARGVSGLSNGSRLDEIVWNKYISNIEKLEEKNKEILSTYGAHEYASGETLILPAGENVERTVQTRKNQRFFREVILASYENTCCITGISIPALLNASHIKPWRNSDPLMERTNPQNGLCLNALHDKAFDLGFITVDQDYRIVLSKQLKEMYRVEVIQEYFAKYDGVQIQLPHRFLPSKEFLSYHNQYIFESY